jgi:hypothetical protein
MLLRGLITELTDVSPGRRDEMFALMDQHYENMRRSDFDRDLAEKRWLIQVIEPDSGKLCGFSTQMMLDLSVAGQPVKALFSGDTIIDRHHWGSPALSLAWGRLALEVIEAHRGEELVWILISKGFRTYRFLPVYFREFYPRFDAPTPERARQIIRAFGASRFPSRYDDTAGVIRALPQGCRLRTSLGDHDADRLHDPHVRHFERANPRHGHGDELICVAPLTRGNFSRTAERLIASPQFQAVALR